VEEIAVAKAVGVHSDRDKTDDNKEYWGRGTCLDHSVSIHMIVIIIDIILLYDVSTMFTLLLSDIFPQEQGR